jgi:hypothetical protein
MMSVWSCSITIARDLDGATTRTTSPAFSFGGNITAEA